MTMPTVTVKCVWIDPVHMAYKCPYCEKTHFHGSQNNLGNRVEERKSHCFKSKNTVKMIIDDETRKEYL